ncbi:hypothetical protein Lalb_Chr01g0010791 [Lupinus albus]|uniref:Uncharacterized protein n=1 Tax=Lupinus albus TaxID=3870 RepID=A0A6A4R548_LUPAL|nr:hypothetical protein Lalb_Chr01g0010791 [Lupinus albus]
MLSPSCRLLLSLSVASVLGASLPDFFQNALSARMVLSTDSPIRPFTLKINMLGITYPKFSSIQW